MSDQPFENGLINLREYEIVPETVPANETPRQFLLRVTGIDFPNLTFSASIEGGRDLTWQEVRDAGGLPIINRIMQIASAPRPVALRKR